MSANTSNVESLSNTLFIDTESDPGSWKQALRYSQHIKVIKESDDE
jgi:hypothetical protein